jgi:hypothetical protein
MKSKGEPANPGRHDFRHKRFSLTANGQYTTLCITRSPFAKGMPVTIPCNIARVSSAHKSTGVHQEHEDEKIMCRQCADSPQLWAGSIQSEPTNPLHDNVPAFSNE